MQWWYRRWLRLRTEIASSDSSNDGDIGYENSVNSHDKIAHSTLITVEQFGHFIWWGDHPWPGTSKRGSRSSWPSTCLPPPERPAR